MAGSSYTVECPRSGPAICGSCVGEAWDCVLGLCSHTFSQHLMYLMPRFLQHCRQMQGLGRVRATCLFSEHFEEPASLGMGQEISGRFCFLQMRPYAAGSTEHFWRILEPWRLCLLLLFVSDQSSHPPRFGSEGSKDMVSRKVNLSSGLPVTRPLNCWWQEGIVGKICEGLWIRNIKLKVLFSEKWNARLASRYWCSHSRGKKGLTSKYRRMPQRCTAWGDMISCVDLFFGFCMFLSYFQQSRKRALEEQSWSSRLQR